MQRIAAFFTPGRALVGVLILLLGSCGIGGEARDRAERAKSVPQGTLVSEGRVNARTFESGLIQERGKHGYLVLRERYLAPEFGTIYAAGLGSREEVMATWEEDRKKALKTGQTSIRIQGKPVTVQMAWFSQFGNRGRQVHYAWMVVNGVGVKVERNEYEPAHLFERDTADSRQQDLDAFREFAESVRVSGS